MADTDGLLAAALTYAARGRPVFPVGSDKRPLTDHGHLDASTDPRVIRTWWTRRPDAGVALVCGPGWWTLDVDKRDALDDLEQVHGFLPDTRRTGTPRGGLHFAFLGDQDPATDCPVRGIDIRGAGKSYVVVPPTPGYHLQLAAPPVPAPAWLLGLIAAKHERERPDGQMRLATQTWTTMLREGIEDGGRNSDFARLVGHWLAHGIPVDEAAELAYLVNEHRTHPPKPAAEVDKIIDSIAAREARQRRERREG
jgi:hypothetical protein